MGFLQGWVSLCAAALRVTTGSILKARGQSVTPLCPRGQQRGLVPSPAAAGNWGRAHLGQDSAPQIQVRPGSAPPRMPQTPPEPFPPLPEPLGHRDSLGDSLGDSSGHCPLHTEQGQPWGQLWPLSPAHRAGTAPSGVPLLTAGSAHPRGLQGSPKAPQEPLGGCRSLEISHCSTLRGSHPRAGDKGGVGAVLGDTGVTGGCWGALVTPRPCLPQRWPSTQNCNA